MWPEYQVEYLGECKEADLLVGREGVSVQTELEMYIWDSLLTLRLSSVLKEV